MKFSRSFLLATSVLGSLLLADPAAQAARVSRCDLGGSTSVVGGTTFYTTDPGDAKLGLVETDDSALTFLACFDPGSSGPKDVEDVLAFLQSPLGANDPSAGYLGRALGGPGPFSGQPGTDVTGTGGGTLSGTWTFDPGVTGETAGFLVLHAGGGTEDDIYQINTPGLTGPWDTSEFFNIDGTQQVLSFLDLYSGNGGIITIPGGGGASPEPASLSLLGGGLAAMGLLRRRSKR